MHDEPGVKIEGGVTSGRLLLVPCVGLFGGNPDEVIIQIHGYDGQTTTAFGADQKHFLVRPGHQGRQAAANAAPIPNSGNVPDIVCNVPCEHWVKARNGRR